MQFEHPTKSLTHERPRVPKIFVIGYIVLWGTMILLMYQMSN